jgi:glycosyltransferase involved in cell wall biosynthesis
MKILMIAPEPFLEPRGTPISVYQRLHALSLLQVQIELLTYHVGQEVSIPGVVIRRIPRVPFIKKVKLGPSWAKALLDVLLFCQATVMLARNRYDAIHSHEEAAFMAALLSKVFRTRHVYDMHSCLSQQLASNPRWNLWPFVKLFERLERWVFTTCDAVITIGADLEEHVKAVNPEAKTFLIQNLAVQAKDDGSSEKLAGELKQKMMFSGKLPVVYTGSFEHYQGLDLLLRSAKIVKEQYPAISFILVGGDPQQVEHWRQQSKAYGLEDCVLFTGIVPLANAIAYLGLAEILVSPRTEGTSVPLKLYSYLNSGKPIVATDLPAHSQVLTAEMALLVAPTEEAFATGILALAESPVLRERLGHRGQELARERFSPADYLERLHELYGELVRPTDPGHQPAAPLPSDPAYPAQQQSPRLP